MRYCVHQGTGSTKPVAYAIAPAYNVSEIVNHMKSDNLRSEAERFANPFEQEDRRQVLREIARYDSRWYPSLDKEFYYDAAANISNWWNVA